MNKRKLYLSLFVIVVLFSAGLLVCYFFHLGNSRNTVNNNQELVQCHFSNPNKLDFFETAFKFKKKQFDLDNKEVLSGVIPHHLLAADLIAEFFYNLQNKQYDTIILIGPNHFNTGDADITMSGYDWQTAYGKLECDQDVLKELLDSNLAQVNESIFDNEHAITSEVSFIKKTFPTVKFVPIILKANVSKEQAIDLANELFEINKSKNILVLASIDFSHYKNSFTAQVNDKESISAIQDFDFNKIYGLDIDSPASMYALLKFNQLNGAKFELLINSNSAILANKPDLDSTTSYVTGYFIK